MRQLILDTNVLVLLIVGLTDINLIGKHKRTCTYNLRDFKRLRTIIDQYCQIVITPHILSETSNLLSQTGEISKTGVLHTFKLLMEKLKEEAVIGIKIVKHESFDRFGITDCGILQLLNKNDALITTDVKLYLEASKIIDYAINFNHLKN